MDWDGLTSLHLIELERAYTGLLQHTVHKARLKLGSDWDLYHSIELGKDSQEIQDCWYLVTVGCNN